MNEIILIIVIVVLLFGTQFLLHKVQKPSFYYIRIIAACALLAMTWFSYESTKVSVLVVMTAVVLFSLVRDVVALQKFKKSNYHNENRNL